MHSRDITGAHRADIRSGERFEFGDNWHRYLELVTEDRIRIAEKSLQAMIGMSSFAGRSFVDVGCGSGLFSLAARRLGAAVHSFDYDPQSVHCAQELRARYSQNDRGWTIDHASVLDDDYLRSLGTFDIVYSWGVLHHTGDMWRALETTSRLVNSRGLLFISIYNDAGGRSRRWTWIKKAYNTLPKRWRFLIMLPGAAYAWGPSLLRGLSHGRPLDEWAHYRSKGSRGRGMSPYRDLVDWVGGFPYEFATPEQIFAFYHMKGFQLERLTTQGGGVGCNQFVFSRGC